MVEPYYSDERVTLYHGDCLEITDWLDADVLVTDPPYGISLCAAYGIKNVPVITGEIFMPQTSDREIPVEHVALRDEALAIWGNRPSLVFGSWRAPRPSRTQMRLVWDKGGAGMGGVGPWRQTDEEIYVRHWPNPKFRSRPYGTVIRVPNYNSQSADRPEHPTPKPISLMEVLIVECPSGVVADPFAGSGSTLVAARNQGRKAIGVEIEERYCELIATRLSQACFDFGEGA